MQKKYERIVAWVQSEIENGSLSRGNKLPSENDLMERFGVSRQTVRRAMEALTQDGVVEGRRGSGTYVTVNTRLSSEGSNLYSPRRDALCRSL